MHDSNTFDAEPSFAGIAETSIINIPIPPAWSITRSERTRSDAALQAACVRRASEAEQVRAGQVLAVIENVSLDAGRERAEGELERLEEQYASMARLHEDGVVSDREMDDLTYQLQSARASHREADHSFQETKIEAPFSGVVALRDVRVGELATSSRRAFQVVDMDRLRVVASLPERDISRVSLGQSARLISAYDEGVSASATVDRIAPVVDPSSGTFRVTVALDPGQTALRPGQFVSVEIEVAVHEDVVVVPKEALVYDDGRPVVFVVVPEEPPDADDGDADEDEAGEQEDGGWFGGFWSSLGFEEEVEEEETAPELGFIAERRPLELGLQDDQWVEIISGVQESDRVILVGQSNLRDGSLVREASEEEDEPLLEADAADLEDQG